MTTTEGSAGLGPGASAALGRMLAKEDRVSDLLALLAAVDPVPLTGALGLQMYEPEAAREVMLRFADKGGEAGRADLLVRGKGRPAALLEIKVAAAQHGDQFERYDRWAREQDPQVRCFLVGLVEETDAAPDGWRTDLTLPTLLRAWQRSQDPHAAWLAGAAAGVLAGWVRELDEPIGTATAAAVADLVSRRVATDLLGDEGLRAADLHTGTGRTSGGTASVVAWLPVPGLPAAAGAWLCVDLRATSRAHPGLPWLLRLGVEVGVGDDRTLRQARVTAHDLALPLRPALTCSSLHATLLAEGRHDLATTLSPWPKSRDGLRGVPDATALDKWRKAAESTDKPGAHPALYNDWGRRLAAQIRLDVLRVDRHQLVDLIHAALRHLARAAGQQGPAAHTVGDGTDPADPAPLDTPCGDVRA